MKIIKIKNKLTIVIAIYLAAIFGAVYFLIFPMISKVKESSDNVQKKMIDRKIEQDRIGRLSQMEKDWKEIEDKKNLLDIVLSKESEVGLIEDIESIAEKTGNTITMNIGDYADPKEILKMKRSIKKKKESDKGILDEIVHDSFFPVTINLKGNYTGLLNFVNMLENGRFFVNIISIDIIKEKVLEKDVATKKIGEEIFSDIKYNAKKESEDEEKEIISSDINALVYTKK